MKLKLFLCLISCVSLLGCGKGANVQAVTGKVTLDGNPIAGATITFSPATGGTGKAAAGMSDSSGMFKISDMASGAEGAVTGDYEIGVLWFKPSVDTSKATGESGGGDAKKDDDKKSRTGVSGPDALLPAGYQDPKTSGIKFTVKEGKNELNIELDSKYKPK